MLSWLADKLLRIWGFKVLGDPANDLAKKIYVVVPHTSNWDFPLGILLRTAKHIDVQYIGKDSLFRPPFGVIFKWLGGHPVDRSRRGNFVYKVVELYQRYDRFAIAIAPEGTRKKVDKLKTGFYHIAKLAGVPMVLTKFDYGTKSLVFSKPMFTSLNQDKDMERIEHFFKGALGKVPANSYNPKL
ncbi:MAG: acyltransferase [Saprospiraceae bacterium]|nr:acyltransferase [Saprospiraceae bacterium]